MRGTASAGAEAGGPLQVSSMSGVGVVWACLAIRHRGRLLRFRAWWSSQGTLKSVLHGRLASISTAPEKDFL